MSLKDKSILLANKALNNPSLLNTLPDDTFFSFVIGIAKFDIELAKKVESLKPFTNPHNKVLFWEAVGILLPQDSLI
jgi:hypothetical protein